MSLYRSQSSPQGAKRFRMNSSYHDATYSRDHRSFRHDGLCNRCKRPGHFARDCPNMTVQQLWASWVRWVLAPTFFFWTFHVKFKDTRNCFLGGLLSIIQASLCSSVLITFVIHFFVSAILLLDATQILCVGTARSLDTMLAIAPMIQSAIHVVRWGTLLASAVTLIFQFRMQVSAIIDIGQATLLLTVEIRRPATTAGKLVILLVIALTSQPGIRDMRLL